MRERRYQNKIPPGYKDARKGGDQQYGDLILWLQVIDQAKESGKPIVFVTDDRKDDWWLNFKGKTIGPLPELIDEIRQEANVLFHMYTPDLFMSWAGDNLQQSVSQEAIGEVQDLRSRDDIGLESDPARGITNERLASAMESLTLDEELVFRMHFYEGLDIEETAEQMELTRLWATRTLNRAMNKMRTDTSWRATTFDIKKIVMEAIQTEWDKTRPMGGGVGTVSSKVVYDDLTASGMHFSEEALAETLEELQAEGRIRAITYHDRDAIPIHGARFIIEPGRMLRSP